MKLLNLWSQNLSVGLAVAACVSPAFADGTMSKGGSVFKPASFASIKKDAQEASYAGSQNAAMPPDFQAYQMAQMAAYQQPSFGPPEGFVSPAAYSMAASEHAGMGAVSCNVPYGCEVPGGVGGYGDGMEDGGLMGSGILGGGRMHGGACSMAGAPFDGQSVAGCPCGMSGGIGNGCGPLGCNGGTFGDGRSVRSLFGGCQGRFRGLLAAILTPYGEGGVASQRWFDFSAEATAFQRTKGAARFDFSTQGLGTNNYVLTSDNVDLDNFQAGLALQANVQVGPGSNLEAVYFGLNKWNETSTVTSSPVGSATLYSFISDFGTSPFNGYDDPDRSFTHSLNYESAFNNGEVNFRRRWVEPSGFLQGSCLAGIRYFQLDESLTFSARGENNNTAADNGPRFFDNITSTQNQLTGFQIGGDLWLNLVPGIKLGTELKTGVYGNHAVQQTQIFANSLGSTASSGIPAVNERASDGRTAYLTQWSVSGVYRLTYAWTVRSSYQLLYVDNVALAPENVNSQAPGLLSGNPNQVRTVSVQNDGEVLYTGFTVGAEYTW